MDQLPGLASSSSRSSRTRPAGTRSTATPRCAASRATATTTSPPTPAAATSTSTTAATCGPRRGCRSRRTSTTSRRATAWATRASRASAAASRSRPCSSCPSARTPRSSRSRSPTRPTPTKTVSLFSFVEFCLWNAQDDQTNYQRNLSIGEVEVEQDGPHGSAIYHKTEYRERRDHYAVYGVNAHADGLRHRPRHVRRRLQRPRRGGGAARRASPPNSVASGWYPIGSHSGRRHARAGRVPRRCTFVLGYLENPDEEKWADDAHQVINKEPRARAAGPLRDDRADRRRVRAAPRALDRPAVHLLGDSATTRSSTGWSTSGTSTSAWSRSTCRARPRSSRPASAAGWASATPTRTCSASCT